MRSIQRGYKRQLESEPLAHLILSHFRSLESEPPTSFFL
ncbi:hypothetical protein M2145_002956, partial [Lachnospiraceae bacterium PF1-21]